jgi:hypothetical protein
MMSVRATERLIGEIVITPGLSNGPKMIVQSVDIESKLITTVWFSGAQEIQEGIFPSSALEKVDVSVEPAKNAGAKGRKASPKK